MDPVHNFSIELLTSAKENGFLEVKSARGGLPNSLWESYSAFANSNGGIIVLGVKEKKDSTMEIEGLEDAHKLLGDFWNIVNNRQKVSCNILTDNMATIESSDGKNLIVIRVPRAERTSRPVYIGTDPRTGSYRRNGEGDYHCSLEEVSLMIRDSALVSDDSRLLTSLNTDIFSQDTVRAYRTIFKLVRNNHLWNKEEDSLFLRRIGAVREDKDTGMFHPTVAGLLMFGYESEITSVFPNYFLDYQEERSNGIYARWHDRITSQTGDWSGNVFDFILKIIPKLQADLKVPFMFKGNLREEDTPLHKILREALVNMLTNADFYGRRGVVVRKSSTGFIFSNPGGMRVTLTEALQDSASDPRNGMMMKMLSLVAYGERAGSGLQGIFTTWNTVFHSTPQMSVSSSGGVDRTILKLLFEGHQPDLEAMKRLFVSQNPENVSQNSENDPQNNGDVSQNPSDVPQNRSKFFQDRGRNIAERIKLMIGENTRISRHQMGMTLGLSSKTISRYLSKMGISWVGHPKSGHWVLHDEN